MTLPSRLVRRLPHGTKIVTAACTAIVFCALLCSASAQAGGLQDPSADTAPEEATTSKSAAHAKQSPEQELQQSIETAGSDRAALVRNLEAYLKKYPESPSRIQIYRALVEADLQLQDNAHATEYAERIVALSPEDLSMTLLTIELLERNGDEAALKRATTYATRVLDFIKQDSSDKRSQRVSLQDWQAEHQRDQMSVLVLRGRLYMKLKEPDFARRDLAASYALLPNAPGAEKLGEIAEMNKDSAEAAKQYARAFALADSAKGTPSRREIREKLGNVWRLAHGSDAGLGDFILEAFDEVSRATGPPAITRNANAKTAFDFTLREAETDAPFPLLPFKGRILVVSFWATWCGPCRALAPMLEHVRQEFQNDDAVQFLGANCDEDESLVAPYLAVEHPKMNMVFADGLDRLLAITSFPTVVVLDREGKIVYRSEGFGDQGFETELSDAIRHATATAPAAPGTPASVGVGR